ncbi:MAG: polymerase sigma-70 factor, subfamily [Actinoplanes sp.]|jgi:RNA polymerase sigma-70 factor (ECF subfamily)|nr:polymerase sigma-70 factor, subfamily [Actinoplanes sp.]
MTEESFAEFFTTNFADVWSFARRRTQSDSDADDIAAETFAVAWRRRDRLPAEAGRLWLFGVARNVLANHRRYGERQRRLHLRLVTLDPPPAVQHDPPASEQVVWAALADLCEDDRELMLLRAWDGLSVADMAAVLGISAANVSSRLYKAKIRLQHNIERRDPQTFGQVLVESHGKGSNRS